MTTTDDIPVLEPEPVVDDNEFSQVARTVLAALAAGAGAIHLAMVAPHAQDSTADGILFAVAGWAQITLAFFLYAKCSRKVLGLNIVVNLALLGAWAVSRTVGLPWSHGGEAEDVGSIDSLCAIFEGLLVVASAVVLAKPRIGENVSRSGLVLGAGIPALAVMALTTGALVSEDGTHTHGEGDEHGHADLATGSDDHPHDTAAMSEECADHTMDVDHAAMSDEEMAAQDAEHETCMAEDGHAHDAAEEEVAADDRCDADFNIASYWHESDVMGVNESVDHGHDEGTLEHHASGMHEQEAAQMVVELSEMSDAEYEEWLANMNPATRDPDAPDDTGSGGHMGAQPWVPMTDPADCEVLASELEQAAEVATRYPTVAEAKAAGYFMVAPYVPGIASHWMNFRHVDGEFSVDEPEMLLFDGNWDHSQIVGLSYYIINPGDQQPTVGFSSENDLYHRHIGLCLKDGTVIADTSVTDEECEAMGGHKSGGEGGWMSHAWVVPGCESPWGVFSAANPVLDRVLVDHSGEGDPCSGSSVADRYDFASGFPDE